MYVGIIELFLEFVKPVTLSMRLFGNIYGGEVALAVITALTIAVVPVALVGLEALLNLIQALIFSVLTLMFILIAIEGHGSEEHGAESAATNTGRLRAPTITSPWRPDRQPVAADRPSGRNKEVLAMEHIGAGLAALGVIGPGIGIGILAGMSSTRDRAQPRRGRPDPRPRDHPRRLRRRPRRSRDRRRPARALPQVARTRRS